jgi:hypothetical protein
MSVDLENDASQPLAKPNRRRRYRWLLVACGLMGGLAIAELSLAILNVPARYQPRTYPPQFFFPNVAPVNDAPLYMNSHSTDIVFEYDGNPRGYFGDKNEVVHSTNSLGFRGGEFALKMTADGIETTKRPNVLRIAFLGDSFTFGEGVNFADTYSEQAIAGLNESIAASPNDAGGNSARQFEAYNFGVGGYNTTQALNLLNGLALGAAPDLVVLGYVLNDAELPLFQVDQQSGKRIRIKRETENLNSFEPPTGFFQQLRTVQLLTQFGSNKAMAAKYVAYHRSIFNDDSASWQASQLALTEIITACDNRKIPCIVVLFPALFRLDDYPFLDIHQQIQQVVSEAVQKTGAEPSGRFVDLRDHLQQAGLNQAEELWVHPTDHHPNEIVHRIAGQQLQIAIKKLIESGK